MKFFAIKPACNEAENIAQVVEELEATVPEYDYVIVNDESVDDTAKIYRERGYHLLDLPTNFGPIGVQYTNFSFA